MRTYAAVTLFGRNGHVLLRRPALAALVAVGLLATALPARAEQAFELRAAGFDATGYPTIAFDVRVQWWDSVLGDAVGSAEGFVAGLIENGQPATPVAVSYGQQLSEMTETLHVTYTSALPESVPREVMVHLEHGGLHNGAGGEAFQAVGPLQPNAFIVLLGRFASCRCGWRGPPEGPARRARARG